MYQSIFSLQNGTKIMTNSDLGINLVGLVFHQKKMFSRIITRAFLRP